MHIHPLVFILSSLFVFALSVVGCSRVQTSSFETLLDQPPENGPRWERYRRLTSPPNRRSKLEALLRSWEDGDEVHRELILTTLCDAELADSSVLEALKQHIRKNPNSISEFARIRAAMYRRALAETRPVRREPGQEVHTNKLYDTEFRASLDRHRRLNPRFDTDLDAPHYFFGQRVKKDSLWAVELMYQSWFVIPDRTTSSKVCALMDVAIAFNRPELILATNVGGPEGNLDEQWDYARTWMRDNARYFYFDRGTFTYHIDDVAKQQAKSVDWQRQSSE